MGSSQQGGKLAGGLVDVPDTSRCKIGAKFLGSKKKQAEWQPLVDFVFGSLGKSRTVRIITTRVFCALLDELDDQDEDGK